MLFRHRMSSCFSGRGISTMALVFSGSGFKTFKVSRCPWNATSPHFKSTFSLLSSFPSLDICPLKSLPIDELGNWCQERLIAALRKYVAQQGGFHGDPVSGNQPCQQPPTSTLKELKWKYLSNRVLTLFWLPKRVGRAVNLLSKQCSKNCCDSKARADGE